MANLLSNRLFGLGQLSPRVDAEPFIRILKPNRRHSVPLLDGHLHDVRQIKFSLRIVRLQAFERREQEITFDDVGAHIDFIKCFDRRIGVTVLHDARHAFFRGPHHPTVSTGII